MVKRQPPVPEDDGRHDHILRAFGDTVRRSRKARGLTQEELGNRAGMLRPYVAELERGAVNASLKTLARIAEAVELDPREFLPTGPSMEMSPELVRQLRAYIAEAEAMIEARHREDAMIIGKLSAVSRILADLVPTLAPQEPLASEDVRPVEPSHPHNDVS